MPPDAYQLACYHVDGYLILRDFLPRSAVAAMVAEAETLYRRFDLIRALNLRCRWQESEPDGKLVFDAFDPVIDIAPACRELARGEVIQGLMRSIYGEPAHLFRDKLIFKKPGSRGYDLHQDLIPGTDFPGTFATVLVPLDAGGHDNGCVEVFPGCHREGYLAADPAVDPRVPPAAVAGVEPVPLELEPGDVALFPGFTPHRSGANRSGGFRRQLYLSYNAASDGGDRRETHYRQYHRLAREELAARGKTETFFR